MKIPDVCRCLLARNLTPHLVDVPTHFHKCVLSITSIALSVSMDIISKVVSLRLLLIFVGVCR